MTLNCSTCSITEGCNSAYTCSAELISAIPLNPFNIYLLILFYGCLFLLIIITIVAKLKEGGTK
jgi:hypothetical protein